MALTPLEVEVLNPDGSPAAGATIELRHKLTGATADGYEWEDGTVMTPPILTDSSGAAQTWLDNGLIEWRSVGTVTTGWRAFRAYAGKGREALQTSSPAAALPTTDSMVFGSGGIDNLLGRIKVTVTFAHEHMADAVLMLVKGNTPVRVAAQLPVIAADGGGPLTGATIDVRNAVTGAAATITDSGGTPLSTPYLTDGGYLIGGYLPPGIYEWRVAASTNIATYRAASTAFPESLPLWNGPNNASFDMADWSFNGTVHFYFTGSSDSVAFASGDTLFVDDVEDQPSDGTWTLWIAGGTPGTPGDLTSWTLEMVSV